MRSLLITAAVVAVAIALSGCPYHRPKRIPGPQSSFSSHLFPGAASHRDEERAGGEAARVGGIRFFQGSLDEAFSRRPCGAEHAQFRD